MKRTIVGLAAVALSAGVLAGCGGSSTSSSTSSGGGDTVAQSTATTPALDKATYIAKVNAICTKLDDTNTSLDNADIESVSQARAAIAKANATAEAALADLDAIVPPANLQGAHDMLVKSSQQSITLFNSLVNTLESGKTPTAAQLKADAKKAGKLYVAQRLAVKQLGLSNCFAPNTGDDAGDSND